MGRGFCRFEEKDLRLVSNNGYAAGLLDTGDSRKLRLVIINVGKDQSAWLLIFSKNIQHLGQKCREGRLLSFTRVGV